MDIFINRLKEAMQKKQITAAKLSAISGISKPLISMYLSGKTTPRERNIQKLAEALEVDCMWLSGNDLFCDSEGKRFKKVTLPVLFEAE